MGVRYKPGDIVSANYNFEKDRNEDLSFMRDEKLRILKIAKDPNWAHAKNSSGETGLIPLNYVTLSSSVKEDIQLDLRYHGHISRSESGRILSALPPGSFLIRDSDVYPGDFTLCVVGPGTTSANDPLNALNGTPNRDIYANTTDVQHYHIVCKVQDASACNALTRSSNMCYSLDEVDWFVTLHELIAFYSVPDSGLVTPLTNPVPAIQRMRLKKLQDQGWIIPRSDLVLGDQIGHGEFGEVLQATYKNDREVAVKIYKNTASTLAITYEAELMTKLSHPNLVAFIGVVYEPDSDVNGGAGIHLVSEYLAQGNLQTYLHSRTRDEVTDRDKLEFSLDVCHGLAHLEKYHVVHRDIAARNVLLSNQPHRLVAKLADFGMARDLSHRANSPSPPHALHPLARGRLATLPTTTLNNGEPLNNISNTPSSAPPLSSPMRHPLALDDVAQLESDGNLPEIMHHHLSLGDDSAIPIKWTAPEAVRKRLFTTKSDVWGFGVLLWEIYSYGRIPYPRMMANQAIRQIFAGYRMKAPEGCPPEVYRLMRHTWHIDPDERPTFRQLELELTRQLENPGKSPSPITQNGTSALTSSSCVGSQLPPPYHMGPSEMVSVDLRDPWRPRVSGARQSSYERPTDGIEYRPGLKPLRGSTMPRNPSAARNLPTTLEPAMSRSFTMTAGDAQTTSPATIRLRESS